MKLLLFQLHGLPGLGADISSKSYQGGILDDMTLVGKLFLCTSSVVMFRFLVRVKKSRSVFKFLDITVPPIGAFLRRIQ